MSCGASWKRLLDDQLLHITGSIDAGLGGGPLFEGARLAATLHGLPHEILTSRELRRRFPAFHLPAETMALYQPEGGFLLPERSIMGTTDQRLSTVAPGIKTAPIQS